MQTNQSHETLCFTTFIPPFPAKFSSHYTTSSQPQATHSSFTLIITDSARQRTTSSFHPPFQKLGIMIIRLSSQPPPLSSLFFSFSLFLSFSFSLSSLYLPFFLLSFLFPFFFPLSYFSLSPFLFFFFSLLASLRSLSTIRRAGLLTPSGPPSESPSSLSPKASLFLLLTTPLALAYYDGTTAFTLLSSRLGEHQCAPLGLLRQCYRGGRYGAFRCSGHSR